jgi:hypothetical protein
MTRTPLGWKRPRRRYIRWIQGSSERAGPSKFQGAVTGFPKFKTKKNPRQSFRIPQRVVLKDGSVYVPELGWVKVRQSQAIAGNHRDAKRLWTAYKTHDSGQAGVNKESPAFRRGEVQLQYFLNTPITRPCTSTEAAGTMIGFMFTFEGCRRTFSPSR